MRIAFISQWFDPEVGSAAIPGSIARALRDRGNQVDVVTGYPNYPHGRLYAGYRLRPLMRETLRGIRVHRVPLYASHDRSAIRRAFSFLSFMISASTLGASIARRSEVALVYSTPATVGGAGIVLRRLWRRPFVLYIQDIWPDTITATGMVPTRHAELVERVVGRFCDWVYSSASRIAVISPGMKDLLVSRGVDPAKVDIIYNWVDEDVFRPYPRRTSTSSFEIMYAGSVGDVQGLDVAVRAIAAVVGDVDVRLRIVGDGVARTRLEDLARQLGVADHIEFEGAREVAEIAPLMASAHIQLVCLRDDPLFHITMPSKIQATLACGQPLIVSAPGDAAMLIRDSGAGIAVGAGDTAALAAAIKEAAALTADELTAMGKRGRTYYEARLCADVGARMLEDALAAALTEGGGRHD